MENRASRAVIWAVLAVILVMLLSGVRVNWMFYAMASSALLILLMFLEYEDRHSDSRTVALIGVMVALTVASRQMLHGIEFSPVFFLVILTGYVFGFTPGFTVGALTMFVSNFFLGQGPWTLFQMFGMGLTGAFASFVPKIRRLEVWLLMGYSMVSAYAYGVITDMFFWTAMIPAHTMESFLGLVGAGMFANTIRAVGNVFFMSIMGPTLLRILERFRRRLNYVRVNS